MQSMTGYGRCQRMEDGREMTCELKSVNHRFLDLSYRLPRNLTFLDDALRGSIAARLSRGHVDVFVTYANHRQDAREVCVDTALAQAYARAFGELQEALGLPDAPVALSEYAHLPDVLSVREREEDQQAVRELFTSTLDGALDALFDMRAREGEKLREDVLDKIAAIEALKEQIALRAPVVVEEARERLRQRIGQLTDAEIDEGRLAMEVALFADRAAIDEELVRLSSHIEQVKSVCAGDGPSGRKLDFLVQEMGREINTIGSKAQDTQIAGLVIAAKGELEKLREQVQNIE